MNIDQQSNRSTLRTVAFARMLLVVFGILWGAFGLGIVINGAGTDQYWGIAMVVLGITHFIAARYASRRVALFLAWFGP